MKRPKEHEYTSHVAYSRALEAYCDLLEQPAQDEQGAWETFALKFANGTRLSYEKPENLPAYLDCRPLYTRPQAREPEQPAQDEPPKVKVSALEFVEMVYEKEHLIGRPIVWAEWPTKEVK